MHGSFSSFSRFKGFCIAGCRGPAGRAPLSDKRWFVGQRYSSLFPLREQNAAQRIARSPHRKSYADHPTTLGFQDAILRRRGRERQTLGHPPAVRSGQPIRGPEGVLSCGRKRESTPDRTHVLVFAWTDVRTCSRMSGCTNTNILARPLTGKSESEHPSMHDCRHPFTDSCRRSCLHPFTHRFTPD